MNEQERGTIIVVARNNLHLTRKAVRSALAQDVSVDVLVIDNASTDGTAQWLQTVPISKASWMQQRSLAACWNFGLRSTFARGAAHALVINNDAEIRPETYRQLLGFAYDQLKEFVTCVSVDTVEQAKAPIPSRYHARPHPDFSCFLLTQKCFETVGEFREDFYPAYVEDSDYHVRMHRAGIEAVCIDLPFLHHGASTIKAADPAERKIIARGAEANREKFRREYGCLPGTPEYESLFLPLVEQSH